MTIDTQRTIPVSLRISVTDSCQLHCLYCRSVEEDDKNHPAGPLTFDEIMNFVNFLNQHYLLDKVHITGGEPLVRHGIVELISRLSASGVRNLALTTNGQLLGELAHSLKCAGLERINISLDSLDQDNFYRLTQGGDLFRTIRGIEAAIESGFSPVKLNTVVLKNINDHEIINIARYGMERNCQVRFLELMPIGVSAAHFHDWFVSSAEIITMLARRFELRPASYQPGGSSRNYTAFDSTGKAGIIGFISPYTAPFCEGCRRLRLSAYGRLLGCLARTESYEIRSLLKREYLSYGDPLFEVTNSALINKHRGRRFDTHETMLKIGG